MPKCRGARTTPRPCRSTLALGADPRIHTQQHPTLRPIRTAIALINWWEGRGSKAHQFLELALEADPNYRLARLSDQMIGTGMVAGWSIDKGTAYRDRGLEAS